MLPAMPVHRIAARLQGSQASASTAPRCRAVDTGLVNLFAMRGTTASKWLRGSELSGLVRGAMRLRVANASRSQLREAIRGTRAVATLGGLVVGVGLGAATQCKAANEPAAAAEAVAHGVLHESPAVPAVAADGDSADAAPTREPEVRVVPLLARVGKLFAIKKVAVKQAVSSKIRYLAYSSDVGESFRPVLSPHAVRATYGIAIGYVCCDVGYHVYQETQLPDDVAGGKNVPRCVVHNTVFQLIASLALPAFIIHAGVHQAQRTFKKLGRYTKWGPTVVGLAMIPFLPTCVDYPAEVIIDTGFAYAWPHPVRSDTIASAAGASICAARHCHCSSRKSTEVD